MADPKSPTLLDRFKALNNQGANLQNQQVQLQQQLGNVQQALAETSGAVKLLLDIDPTLLEQFNKDQQAAAEKTK